MPFPLRLGELKRIGIPIFVSRGFLRGKTQPDNRIEYSVTFARTTTEDRGLLRGSLEDRRGSSPALFTNILKDSDINQRAGSE